MMTKNRLSPRHQEMLSAYLDGQLSPREVARLQARLQDDRQMQIALEELRMTRAALRSLPMLRAPRNFTLTPQMVGIRKAAPRPAYPAFGFASLVASLLLVLVFVADRISFINTAQTAALQSAAQATQMEELVQTMVVESLAAEGLTTPAEDMLEMAVPMAAEGEEASRLADSTAEEPVEALSMPFPEATASLFAGTETEATEPVSSKMAPDATSTASSVMQQSSDISPMITPTPSPTPFIIDGTVVQGVGGGAPETPRESYTPTPEPSETPEPSPTPSPTCTLEPTPTPTPTDTPLPTDTPAPVSEALEMQLPASETPRPTTSLDSRALEQPSDQTYDVRQPSRALFLALEIVLGLLAAGSAIIFIILYRKSN